MEATARSRILASFPPGYPIIDVGYLSSQGISALDLALAAARSGVRILQYRLKGDYHRREFEEAAEVVARLRRAGICCIVNDRADIAVAVGADGVHVGQLDLPPSAVRRIVGPEMLVGYSTHSAAQAADKECEWADYLAIGPVFATSSKHNPDPVVGLGGVSAARRVSSKPLVAIGGISLGNCRQVLQAGADSVAAISAVTAGNLREWGDLRP